MQEAYLEMVTSANNNKYYHMRQIDDNTFEVQYGRIGASAQRTSYSMSQWYKKYDEKIRKGYKDTTHLQAKTAPVNTQDEYKPILDQDIASLIDYLQRAANDTIKANYKIAANAVSAAMIREAQHLIDNLVNIKTKETFNDTLLELFTALPRKMSNVASFLLNENTSESREKIITREQQLLDIMSSQAVTSVPGDTSAGTVKNDMTILEAFHLKIEPVTDTDIALIKKELGESAKHFYKAWKVTNEETEAAFQAHVKANKITKRKRKLFWHGSRTENWWGFSRPVSGCARPT